MIQQIPTLKRRPKQCDCSICNDTRNNGTYDKEYKNFAPCKKSAMHFQFTENIDNIVNDDVFYIKVVQLGYLTLYSITLVIIVLLLPMLFLI